MTKNWKMLVRSHRSAAKVDFRKVYFHRESPRYISYIRARHYFSLRVQSCIGSVFANIWLVIIINNDNLDLRH